MEGLERLIDHAPLFPPASLDMPAAVAEDSRARASEHAWMLARFVCPASRLGELERERGWADAPPLSVVLDANVPLPAGAPVEAIEMARLPRPGLPDVELFCEVPVGDLEAVAAAGAKGKLRCGGARVPSVEEVAAFFATARDLGLPFKATAGLHHPIRSGDQHGFLNFLTAADRAAAGADEAELREILASTDRSALGTGSARGRELFVSIGSCSFAEPVADLQELGLL